MSRVKYDLDVGFHGIPDYIFDNLGPLCRYLFQVDDKSIREIEISSCTELIDDKEQLTILFTFSKGLEGDVVKRTIQLTNGMWRVFDSLTQNHGEWVTFVAPPGVHTTNPLGDINVLRVMVVYGLRSWRGEQK